ncbi:MULTISPECIES: phosphate butyryltransferase [Bacillus]|jgi:phosphate butyryltransferase|uniref:phosphate butyryltransferase n=1 Tax=Bacillus TaxID=1386 RepID=UPI0003304FBC|nr:phosphate butyryltransferase [Bacillus cereus BAG2O-3]EOQ09867.1 phosphate butyryltransferase [Bacillus cereus B5-2]EOQ27893.1 phosphate butyryltransferase [Bacillus cereus BAG3O-1]MBJ8114476.1 phosphate butyryltransferase [Bacillus cereus]PFW83458.1 phosphate butyryltransferase [Bacillus sp. AFS075960]RFB16535.1 phosphate butyryltransferase [Bacillus sp. OE]RFB24478.1 phosphate butyryltransferase [Bacillus sp. LB(2018)]RFB50213.1 phosphate butyryltransferase [Bacillus sp. dmp10]
MKLEHLIDQAAGQPKKTVAVAVAEDHEVIEAVAKAIKLQLAQFRLYGNQEKIMGMLQEHGLQTSEHIEVIAAQSSAEAAELSVKAVRNGEADVLMKGNIPTANILKAVLNKEWGLRKGSVLSHVAAFEVPNYDRLIFVTDAAMNIAPDVTQKAAIIQNTVEVAQAIGMDLPKVAPIAAVEVVNPAMQATIDAAMLTQMNRRGQIKNCVVDGPLALDNAVSQIAAEHKGIVSDVAGKADILLVPTIEAGNVLYKSLVYFADAKVGAMIAGAKAPIVLTSRADSAETKVYSLALAVATASK